MLNIWKSRGLSIDLKLRFSLKPWADDIKKWVGGSLAVASNKAKDREGWRALVKTTTVPVGTF